MDEGPRGTGEREDVKTESSTPPLARVAPALRSWWRSLAVSRGDLRRDAIAEVPGAVGSVPDGRAASVLIGVNPIHGLYASFAGPIFGGLTSSTRLMDITTTSLYYAGARTLAARLPDPQGANAPVVVRRLRGRTALGVTSFKILSVYAKQLEEVGDALS